MNISTPASPYRSNVNLATAPANTKYSDRNPRMANTFEVNTISGSRVSAKIAGTESMANTISLISIAISARNSGVACQRPAILEKKCLPS